jgi:hypothetical protein
MDEPKTIPPRQRLKELLAIPERERTDAQWDEMNELEISLASGNREGAPDQNVRQQNAPRNAQQNGRRNSSNNGPRPQSPNGGPQGQKPSRKFHKRPPKGRPA